MHMKLDLTDMLYALSFALDKVEFELLGLETGHGKRVACLSLFMAQEAGIKGEELRDLVGCCVLHDNALTEFIHEELSGSYMSEGLNTQTSDLISLDAVTRSSRHSVIGERNIRLVPFRTNVENIILYHHENADGSGPLGKTAAETGLKPQLLHLADMVDMSVKLTSLSEEQYHKTLAWVEKQSGKLFSEEAVKLFRKAITYDRIAHMMDEGVLSGLQRQLQTKASEYTDEEIHNLAGLFARIIDYKSEFTQTHSLSVADKAEQMARYYGFDREKTIRYYLAGALHDIGKLVVSNDILEKPGKLTDDEYSAMKDHASATRYILSQMKEIPDIIEWASNHHETLNGSGYPRGLTAEELSFEERLMACIDIYQALTETRPYKEGLSHEKTISIMKDMTDKGTIDGNIVRDMESVMA